MKIVSPLPGFENILKPFRFESPPHEYKVTPLRECPTPTAAQERGTPGKDADDRNQISSAE
jgi:hypothetical protein